MQSYEVGLLMRVHAEDDEQALGQFRNAYPGVDINTVRPATGQRALPEEIERARRQYATDWIAIDDNALASRYETGTWIQAWVDLEDEVTDDDGPSEGDEADCSCGLGLVYTGEEWQHDAAPWRWSNDHEPNPQEGT